MRCKGSCPSVSHRACLDWPKPMSGVANPSLCVMALGFVLGCPFSSQAKEYVIQKGDALIRIAKAHGCTLDQLKVRNDIAVHDERIDAGDRIFVDCQGVPADAKPLKSTRGNSSGRHRKAIIRPGRHPVNSKRLRALMRAKGFKPPKDFRALVVEITLRTERFTNVRLISGAQWTGSWVESWLNCQGVCGHRCGGSYSKTGI